MRLFLTVLMALTFAAQVRAGSRCEGVFDRVHDVHETAKEQAPERARKTVDVEVATAIATTPETKAFIRKLLSFAARHGLDERIVEVGPESRRLKRLVVALDVRNEQLVKDYLAEFNIKTDIDSSSTRTLSIEFQKEVPGEYVLGGVRTGDKPGINDGFWRYGKAFIDHNNDWFTKWHGTSPDHIIGFAHLIPVTKSEAMNVEYYLANPTERGPCKSGNCIAWATGVELGKTSATATEAERRPLFTELGVSRSVAHYEIARRLAHAANERHVAMIAYVHDDIGLKAFRENKEILPPEPQQPFEDIVKGVIRSKDSPVMKAMAAIPDGAKVFFPIAAGASPEGMSALIDHAADLKTGVEVHVLVNGISEATLTRGVQTKDGKFRVKALFLGSNARKLHKQGMVEVIPGYLSDFGRLAANPATPEFHYDAMVVRVSPPDKHGRYSLGPNNDMIKTIMRARPSMKIIAEVNPNVPFTLGDNFLTEDQLTAKFHSTAALAGPALLDADFKERAIGKYLAELIPNGSTVQLGIGGLFSGMPAAMKAAQKSGLKFFTEMASDPMKEMVESGVADSIKTGFGYGSSAFYKWLDHNPKVEIIETEVSNDPTIVSRIPGFHAVNTGLQVNLRGDVNAEIGADGYRMSSPGGQVEFMVSGMRAPGGKSIIAIRSTVKEDTISAITLDTYGNNVTTPGQMVTHVVTEFGIAELAGKTEAQRAINLIRVAHPKWRLVLAEQAAERHIITPEQVEEFRPH